MRVLHILSIGSGVKSVKTEWIHAINEWIHAINDPQSTLL